MDPEKLERIQLPVPTAAEKTTYNHLLAERLIRIMNNAAQPGARACGWFPGVGELQGPSPTPAPGAPACRESRRSSAAPLPHTHLGPPGPSRPALSSSWGLLLFPSPVVFVPDSPSLLLPYSLLRWSVVPVSAALLSGWPRPHLSMNI